MFGRKNRNSESVKTVQTVPRDTGASSPLFSRFAVQTRTERELYKTLRESVPIIDAALCKIIRLIGGFKIETDSVESQKIADSFVKNVKTNGEMTGLESFVLCYLDSLLTYGQAVGEMVPDSGGNGICALYNASLDDVEIRADSSPLNLTVFTHNNGVMTQPKHPERIMATLLNPKAGTACGTSILSGLPFVSSILLRIFESIKSNWERVGDIRFAVTLNPDSNGASVSRESARTVADEWRKAMRSDSVCDFVSVGDVNIRVIGAESEMPDCDIPVRHLLEQIIAKLGIPPFLLGISWSSTERMSEQQADILTSELAYYRTVLEPVITKIVKAHLRMCGCNNSFNIIWDKINLQDAVELSQARLNNANAMSIEKEIGAEVLSE